MQRLDENRTCQREITANEKARILEDWGKSWGSKISTKWLDIM